MYSSNCLPACAWSAGGQEVCFTWSDAVSTLPLRALHETLQACIHACMQAAASQQQVQGLPHGPSSVSAALAWAAATMGGNLEVGAAACAAARLQQWPLAMLLRLCMVADILLSDGTCSKRSWTPCCALLHQRPVAMPLVLHPPHKALCSLCKPRAMLQDATPPICPHRSRHCPSASGRCLVLSRPAQMQSVYPLAPLTCTQSCRAWVPRPHLFQPSAAAAVAAVQEGQGGSQGARYCWSQVRKRWLLWVRLRSYEGGSAPIMTTITRAHAFPEPYAFHSCCCDTRAAGDQPTFAALDAVQAGAHRSTLSALVGTAASLASGVWGLARSARDSVASGPAALGQGGCWVEKCFCPD